MLIKRSILKLSNGFFAGWWGGGGLGVDQDKEEDAQSKMGRGIHFQGGALKAQACKL